MIESSIETSFRNWCDREGLKTFKVKAVKGWPDRIVLLPNNTACWIELKTEVGEPDPVQLYVHRMMAEAGHRVFVCHSVTEAVHAVKTLITQLPKRGSTVQP